MTPFEMTSEAVAAANAGTHMVLELPVPFKRPKGFPRGELLCESSRGNRVYRFDPMRILAWLAANGCVVPASTDKA